VGENIYSDNELKDKGSAEEVLLQKNQNGTSVFH
jgi:hypothetical protein